MQYIINDTSLKNISDAIREKRNISKTLSLSDMVVEIKNISTGVDTSADTVVPEALLEGFTAHDAQGQPITGVHVCQTSVVSTPVEATLYAANWSGSDYKLKIENYQTGTTGCQIGLMSKSSIVNTQKACKAAFTVPYYRNVSANTSSGTPAYTEITITAVNIPVEDIIIAVFGLVSV